MTIRADGACARMSPSMAASSPGSCVLTNCSSAWTAATHVLVLLSTHVSMVEEKLASLPPMVTLTSVVDALSAESWLFTTSVVVAPVQATDVKDEGECAVAHSAG